MNRIRLIELGALLVVAIGLTACAPKVTNPPITNDASTQLPQVVETPVGGFASSATPAINDTPVADVASTATPAYDGNALVIEKLENHHSIDRIYNAKHTREEWNATLDRMIGYGAKISEEEKTWIIDYLLSRQ